MGKDTVQAESVVNWGLKHTADLQKVGADLADIFATAQAAAKDFPTGTDFSILSSSQQDQMSEIMAVEIKKLFPNLPPGTIVNFLKQWLPLFLQLIGGLKPTA